MASPEYILYMAAANAAPVESERRSARTVLLAEATGLMTRMGPWYGAQRRLAPCMPAAPGREESAGSTADSRPSRVNGPDDSITL
jgi:hypothetical protein